MREQGWREGLRRSRTHTGTHSRAALASGCGGASQFNRFDIRLELVIGRTNERAPRTRTSGRD